ncbi:MAG: M18 family aminopeptidase [Clostridia bacterium]|nr:M18 family aminopeptidase [Clostridia bacterium]
MNSVPEFLQFVSQAPTAFHAVSKTAERLKLAGFVYLDETANWNLAPGKYYTVKNGTALIAFIVPDSPLTHFQIISSHADSPMLKLKPLPESPACNCYLRLNPEVYGGMIMSTWLDRPLSIAGRVIVKEKNRLSSRLLDLHDPCVLIPNMPIHFNRDINDGFKYNPQVDLLPLFGDAQDKGTFASVIAQALQLEAEQIISFDLFLYNTMPGTVWGSHRQFFSSPRIDDLECAYASLEALLTVSDCTPSGFVPVLALFDNEEVGSQSKQGADSTFLSDTLNRIHSAVPSDRHFPAVIASSFMISADNAHAIHPNHPEKYDEQNRVYMNRGIVIKHSANQKYTTDAISSAAFSEICRHANIPTQHFANRSDIRGGSTLGNIANTHVSMNTVDIGLAQLAMHSSYETAGCMDLPYMIDAMTAFYKNPLEISSSSIVL